MPSNDKNTSAKGTIAPASPKFSELVSKFKDLERQKLEQKQKEKKEGEGLSARSPRDHQPNTGQQSLKDQQSPRTLQLMAKKAGAVHEKGLGTSELDISEKLRAELPKLKTGDKGKFLKGKIAEAIAQAKKKENEAMQEQKRKQESKGKVEGKPKKLKYGGEPGQSTGTVIEAGTVYPFVGASGKSIQFEFPILIDEKGSVFVIDTAKPALGKGSYGEVRVAINIDTIDKPAKSNIVKIFPKIPKEQDSKEKDNDEPVFSDKRLD